MSEVRRIDYYGREIRGRVETGPVQFGDDWPGVFIRGDEALHMALRLREALALMASRTWGPAHQAVADLAFLMERVEEKP